MVQNGWLKQEKTKKKNELIPLTAQQYWAEIKMFTFQFDIQNQILIVSNIKNALQSQLTPQ